MSPIYFIFYEDLLVIYKFTNLQGTNQLYAGPDP